MELAIVITPIVFSLGFFLIPGFTRRLLLFKYQEMEAYWHEQAISYQSHMLLHKRPPSQKGDRLERSLAKWARQQTILVNGKKLPYEKVLALRLIGVIGSPGAGEPDCALSLPSQKTDKMRYQLNPTLWLRLACGGCMTLVSLMLVCSNAGPVSVLSGLAAGGIMLCVLICDMKARLIPSQLCLAFGAVALVFSFSISGLNGLLNSLLAGFFTYLALCLVNRLMIVFSGGAAIGNGDLRLIPLICVFSGALGSVYGFVGASIVMAAIAAFALLFKGANRKSFVPYAPGLTCWYAIGLLAQVSCA